MTYIELHARSAFSFLEGASVPEELIAAAQELDMPAMALLDRNGVYGSPRFHLSAKKNEIKAHIGAEIQVQGQSIVQTPKSRQSPKQTSAEGAEENSPGRKPGVKTRHLIKAREAGDRSDMTVAPIGAQRQGFDTEPRADARGYYLPPAIAGSWPQTFTVPLLVRNRTGYQNLCRLITLMKLRVPKHAKPGECAVTLDELAAHAEGLVCLTGAGDGPLAHALNERNTDSPTAAQQLAESLNRHFRRGKCLRGASAAFQSR